VTAQKTSGATISRFVTWESVRRQVVTAEDQSTLNDLLRQLGVESLQGLHGLEAPSDQGLARELEGILLRYDLGNLAHGYWPTNGSTEAAIPASLLDRSVEILQLSVRSSNCLFHAGIATVGELIQRSYDDLIRLPNMGKKSALEIRERLSALSLDGVLASPMRIDVLPDSFSLATLMALETCGIPKRITRQLRLGGVKDIHDLLTMSVEAIGMRAELKRAELRTLQTRLVDLRLRLGSPPSEWISDHLEELRTAFRVDIERIATTMEEVFSNGVTNQSAGSFPTCLEEELEALIPEKCCPRSKTAAFPPVM
jgi:hypothetical protein